MSIVRLQEALRETVKVLEWAECGCVGGFPKEYFCVRCKALETAYAALALPVEPEKHRLCIDPYCVECQGRRMLPVIDAPRTLVETRPPEPATASKLRPLLQKHGMEGGPDNLTERPPGAQIEPATEPRDCPECGGLDGTHTLRSCLPVTESAEPRVEPIGKYIERMRAEIRKPKKPHYTGKIGAESVEPTCPDGDHFASECPDRKKPVEPPPATWLEGRVRQLCKQLRAGRAAHEESVEPKPHTFQAPGHDYPDDPHHTYDCRWNCGAWAGPTRSGGPAGTPDSTDGFGPCPKAPDECATCGLPSAAHTAASPERDKAEVAAAIMRAQKAEAENARLREVGDTMAWILQRCGHTAYCICEKRRQEWLEATRHVCDGSGCCEVEPDLRAQPAEPPEDEENFCDVCNGSGIGSTGDTASRCSACYAPAEPPVAQEEP